MLLTLVACATFLAYAGCFLYFFVDDEAIPLVYARNLLRGRGFVYTVLEGRVEGYSDFLHVLWSTALLGGTRWLHLSGVAPLLAGKGLSLAAGVGLILLTGRLLRRAGASPAGLAAGLGFLALAGPVAVWSCSSLETATFALMALAFAAALLDGPRWAPCVLGVLLILARTDGMVYAFTLLAAAAAALPGRRREVMAVAVVVAMGAGLYHAWRVVYFGSLLSAPLAAKVLYRLTGTAHAMVKEPEQTYLAGVLHVYGVAAAGVLAAAMVLAWRTPPARVAVLALLALGLYVQRVGDWMFGWRFLVALLPFAAMVIGSAVSRLPRAAGWCVAALVLGWSGVAARAFAHEYVAREGRPIFWLEPRRGEAAWFGRYYDLIRAGRAVLHPGDRIAFNQAGLLPYLLDVENLDDLGICSDFVAKLPTTDVYYTGVGRYSPLTNQPVVRTAHAFLLYHDVQFVISPTDLLYKANRGAIPERILGDRFTRIAVDAPRENAIYARAVPSTGEFHRDPSLFVENLVHLSRVTAAQLDGATVAADRLGPDLPFLREQAMSRSVTGPLRIDLTFGSKDQAEDVYGVFVGEIESELPATLALSVRDGQGRETLTRTYPLAAGRTTIHERFTEGVRGRALTLVLSGPAAPHLVVLGDVRLLGQSAALRAYVRRRLVFR